MSEIKNQLGGFRRVEAVAETVYRRSPLEARTGYRIFRAEGGFEVAVPERLIERALAVGRAWAPTEWYALLVGRLFEYEGQRHVVVDDLVIDIDAKVAPSAVRTTPESELRTRNLARALHADSLILGWAHGHLRHGARFSSVDKRNQATWKRPHSVSIVFDPWDPAELAVYRGPDSELLSRVPPPRRVSPVRRAGAAVRSAASVARARLGRVRSPLRFFLATVLGATLAVAAAFLTWNIGSRLYGRVSNVETRVSALEADSRSAMRLDPSFEERLRRMEAELRASRARTEALMCPGDEVPRPTPACWPDGRRE